MKKNRLALLAGFFLWASALHAGLPWKNGEELTYEVNWGPVDAAEAVFTARQEDGNWILKLDLKSKGMVESFNPIRSQFVSRVQVDPWRSLGYEEDRSEGAKKKKNRTVVSYPSCVAHYEDLLKKEEADVDLPEGQIDDVGSLLYALRNQDWQTEPDKVFVVYDGTKIKYGHARLVKRTIETIGTWPKQKLLVVEAWPEDEKGKRGKGSLKLWITDDEKRLPLRADFFARFGTFQIDLVKVGNTR